MRIQDEKMSDGVIMDWTPPRRKMAKNMCHENMHMQYAGGIDIRIDRKNKRRHKRQNGGKVDR